MYIKQLRVSGFKKFSHLEVDFSTGINVIVGDNDSGKSTILEAIVAVLNGQYRGVPLSRSLSEDLFNAEHVSRYLNTLNSKKQCEPPEILIEIVFGGEEDEDAIALFEGDASTKGTKESGISLKIALDYDSFAEEYQEFIDSGEYYGLPIEYYVCSWTTFARKSIRPAAIKFSAALLGAGNSLGWTNPKAVVSRIARDVLDPNDQIAVSQVHRRMRKAFSSDEVVSQINQKISEKTHSLTRKAVTFGFEAGTVNSWENGIVTKLEDIPFSNVGDGTKSIVGTDLALSKSKDRGKDVILLEEPENHLSHTKLNMLLDDVRERCDGMQLIVTTHSSFVANKLDLRNLILLNGDSSVKLSSLQDSTWRFFMKAPGYKTLRVLLCEAAILVEGDADELVVQRAYRDKHNGKLPIYDGIDVISVGTSFLRFMEIAKAVKKNVIAVTDNDGDIGALKKKYENYPFVTSEAAGDAQQVVSYADRLLSRGEDPDVQYNTLEPEIYESAGVQTLGKILGRDMSDRDRALKHMENNKTDVALAIFDAEDCIQYPEYITRAIEWAYSKVKAGKNV